MNPVRIRDLTKELHRKVGIFSDKAMQNFLDAPLFIYPDMAKLNDDEVEWIKEHVCEGEGYEANIPTRLPYKAFTIHCPQAAKPPKGDGAEACTLWIFGHPHTCSFKGVEKRCILHITGHFDMDGHECVFLAWFTGNIKDGVLIQSFVDGKVESPDGKGQKRLENAIELAHGMRNVLARFCFAVHSPTSAVLRVSPDSGGRTVHWVKAREHYLVLEQHQAAEMRKQARGPSDEEIERAAHWRRGHLRRLTSEKFTRKKGQFVFVRQAWVGPDEWRGSDQKTYKVMHP